MHSFVVLMPSRAVTEGCRAFSTGSYAETIDRCAHAAHRAANLTESQEKNVALKVTQAHNRGGNKRKTHGFLSLITFRCPHLALHCVILKNVNSFWRRHLLVLA